MWKKRAERSFQSPYLSARPCFICAFRFDCSPWKFAFSPVGHMSSSSVSLDFSSEHTLSCYLIKHPRDALEVIGFSTRRRGCRVEFVSMCAWIIFRRRCACSAASLVVCLLCVSGVAVFCVSSESLCFQEAERMSKTWSQGGSGGGCFKFWPEAHEFYYLKGNLEESSKFLAFWESICLPQTHVHVLI